MIEYYFCVLQEGGRHVEQVKLTLSVLNLEKQIKWLENKFTGHTIRCQKALYSSTGKINVYL